MKEHVVSVQYEFIDTHYRASKSIGPHLIHIERGISDRKMRSGLKWETIYHGHIDPIRQAIDFFDRN